MTPSSSSSSSESNKPSEWYTAEWYILEGRDQRGPFSLDQLQEMINRGLVSSGSRVGKHFDSESTNLLVMDLLQSRQDPTFTLLDALQAARNKKALIREQREQSSRQKAELKRSPTLLPSQKVLLFLVTLLLVAFLFLFFKQNRPPALEALPLDSTTPSSSDTDVPSTDVKPPPKPIFKQPARFPVAPKRDFPGFGSASMESSSARRTQPVPSHPSNSMRTPSGMEEQSPQSEPNLSIEEHLDQPIDPQEESPFTPNPDNDPGVER